MNHNVVYVVSDTFDYEATISPAAGPAFAKNYDWETKSLNACSANTADIYIIDNRFPTDELRELSTFVHYICGLGKVVLLKMHDPFVEEQIRSPWFSFAWEMLDKPNFHYASVYSLAECVAALQAAAQKSVFVHMPYTYDSSNELSQNTPRLNKIALSGSIGRKYPLRQRFDFARRYNPFLGHWVSHLKHPGYPDIGLRGHPTAVVGDAYLEALAKHKYAFVCSSRCRIEFLKYREIAYAGCAPIGDVPCTFQDIDLDAYIPWHSPRKLPDRIRPGDSWQNIAANFRRYMEAKRGKTVMKARIEARLKALLATPSSH
jgi:hypothetical protein